MITLNYSASIDTFTSYAEYVVHLLDKTIARYHFYSTMFMYLPTRGFFVYRDISFVLTIMVLFLTWTSSVLVSVRSMVEK